MSGQPTPPLVVEAFAKNAGAPYIQFPIPVTTATPGRASFDQGFPALTMTEVFVGGKPPFGQDMNGILFTITAHVAAANAGQPYLYNSTLSTAMGGYAKGCVVGMSDGTGLWLNTVAGNTTDPDSGGAANWMPLYAYGLATLAGLTGGVVTVAASDYRRGIIVLSGVLTSNLQVVMPTGVPIGQRTWLIVNTCSGAFTVTVKTLAGTGVAIPAGGFAAPTEVYGDGVNIYPTVAPITIPTDINPTPNTIALRTNAGYLFATYFNSSNGVESFSATGVYASAGDGYHRLMSLTQLASQMSLSQFAGQVVNAQVPQSAVTQYTAAILANAALTGAPTAPTPAATDASTRVATTAYVAGSQSIGGNGYKVFPGNPGLILQWGYAIGASSSVGVTFPIAFPNGALAAFCATNRTTTAGTGTNYVAALSASGATFIMDARSGIGANFGGYWFAIGF
jgi:hypothetical protein